jgi:hypothetical protein
MSNAPENFENLQKLLRLKRHEQPPPGYFDSFSNQVIARLEAGDTASGRNWFVELWRYLSARPLSTGLAGATALSLLVLAAVNTHDNTPATPNLANLGAPTTAQWNGSAPTPTTSSPFESLAGNPANTMAANSTNPVTAVEGLPSLFRTVNPLNVERVSFSNSN